MREGGGTEKERRMVTPLLEVIPAQSVVATDSYNYYSVSLMRINLY